MTRTDACKDIPPKSSSYIDYFPVFCTKKMNQLTHQVDSTTTVIAGR